MDDHMVHNIVQEIVEKEIPAETDIWAKIQNKIAPIPLRSRRYFVRAKAWVPVGLVVILALISFFLFTTPGRVFAAQILGLFTRTSGDTFSLSEPEIQRLNALSTPVSEFLLPLVDVYAAPQTGLDLSIPGCQDVLTYESYSCQVRRAEKKVGFDIKEFPYLPNGWAFASVIPIPESQQVTLIFNSGSGYMVFEQGIGEFPVNYFPWENVPEAYVEQVEIGNLQGEYVEGWFVVNIDQKQAVWDPSGFPLRLAWRDGQRWYEITEWVGPEKPSFLPKEKFIELASNLVDSMVSEDKQNLDRIHFTEIAGTVAGFDLQVPLKLPLGVQFSHAELDENNSVVTLFFQGNARIVIRETPAIEKSRLHLSNIKNEATAVMIGEKLGYLLIHPKESLVPTRWGYGDALYFLTWEMDGLILEMTFYKDNTTGGIIHEDGLVAIANNMQKGNIAYTEGTPYSWLWEYENLLGFDVREIQPDQGDIRFYGVEGHPNEQYIVILYKDQTNGSMLFLYQGIGQPIHDPEWEKIPDTFKERVSVGESAELARGNLVGGEWNGDAPYLRIRWKEDSQWFELIAASTLNQNLDREWLIQLAQSIR